MKLDKIKFAKVVQFMGRCFDDSELQELDALIDIDVEPIKTDKVPCEMVDELLKQLNAENGFIDAIKAYRSLTGAGLKESKESIERYRNVPKFPEKKPEESTLGDILSNAIKVSY